MVFCSAGVQSTALPLVRYALTTTIVTADIYLTIWVICVVELQVKHTISINKLILLSGKNQVDQQRVWLQLYNVRTFSSNIETPADLPPGVRKTLQSQRKKL